MKTINEWAETAVRGFGFLGPAAEVKALVRAVRQEVFERCEQEVRRMGAEMGMRAIGERLAKYIAQVRREEGDK